MLRIGTPRRYLADYYRLEGGRVYVNTCEALKLLWLRGLGSNQPLSPLTAERSHRECYPGPKQSRNEMVSRDGVEPPQPKRLVYSQRGSPMPSRLTTCAATSRRAVTPRCLSDEHPEEWTRTTRPSVAGRSTAELPRDRTRDRPRRLSLPRTKLCHRIVKEPGGEGRSLEAGGSFFSPALRRRRRRATSA